jgi:hypothetical protein
MLSGGESFFTSKRTGEITSAEILAKWDVHVAHSFVSQNINDLAAQDLLIHILSPYHLRKNIDMNVILAHPFFYAELPENIKQLLTDAKEERELVAKIKGKQAESDKLVETDFQPIRLGRVGLKTQLRLTNSATEALRECFDPYAKFVNHAPFTLMLLPYELKRSTGGTYSLGTELDMDLAQRFGRQLLILCKALWFGVCYTEKLKSGGEKFEQLISQMFVNTVGGKSDLVECGKDILEAFHLTYEDYGDIATNFIIIVQELIQMDERGFIDHPWTPVLKLISQYATDIANTFSITNRGYLYLVDEFSCTIAHENDAISQYPHFFRDHVVDIAYRCLPYVHTIVSSVLCATQGPEGLLNLLCGGSNSVGIPPAWERSFCGIPTIPLRKRMVMEASLLHKAVHSNLICPGSAIALNDEEELQFFSSLYIHIDSSRTFAGLRPITDETGTMWVTEESKNLLIKESTFESNPERVYEAFATEEIRYEELMEKDRKIAQLEKALRKAQLEIEKTRMMEI